MKKVYLLSILFLVFNNLTFAATSHHATNDSLVSAPVILPLQFSQGISSTIIKINGKPFPLLIDSGASKENFVLSKHVLKDINVNYTGKVHCMTAIDGRYCMKKFTIPKIQIGKSIFYHIPGEELKRYWGGSDKGFIRTEASKNGIIGLAMLTRFNILLDYKKHQMTLLPLTSFPDTLNLSQCHSLKINFNHGIEADYVLHDRTYKLVLDTGANLSLIKPNSNQPYPCTTEHINDFKNCRINKITLFPDQKPVAFYVQQMNVPFDGILGAAFIQNHKIFIDSLNKRLYICD